MPKVIWQPTEGRLGDWLTEQLGSGSWSEAFFVSAFARANGLAPLRPSLNAFRGGGGVSYAWVGIDVLGTSIEALRMLLDDVDHVHVVHNPGPSTFHPKVYAFARRDCAVVAVGSNNLTAGGLYVNVEAALLEEEPAEALAVLEAIKEALAAIPDNNIARLDPRLLDELIATGLIVSEAKAPRAESEVGSAPPPSSTGPFTRTPVKPPPIVRPAVVPAAVEAAAGVQAGLPSAFVMTLGPQDVSQERGHSRDVFIPLAARDAFPTFWKWPDSFEGPTGTTLGTFRGRYANVQIHPARGPASREPRRLYYYKERSEFRLNAGSLTSGSEEGDLLVVELSHDEGVEYDATVVPQGTADFDRWSAVASTGVRRSTKRWGYV